MKGIYFKEKGPALLTQIGMTKSEFALKMGIQRHNVNSLFKNHDLDIIARAANVIGIPLAMLVGYVEEPELADFGNRYEVLPGLVRLTVGLKRSDDSKVQYCITAIGIYSKK